MKFFLGFFLGGILAVMMFIFVFEFTGESNIILIDCEEVRKLEKQPEELMSLCKKKVIKPAPLLLAT